MKVLEAPLEERGILVVDWTVNCCVPKGVCQLLDEMRRVRGLWVQGVSSQTVFRSNVTGVREKEPGEGIGIEERRKFASLLTRLRCYAECCFRVYRLLQSWP